MGSLRQALRGHRVYLDANIFIYALEGIEPWAKPLLDAFSGLEAVIVGLGLAMNPVDTIMPRMFRLS